MVYGLLTELYNLPSLAEIEVTVLRGARRMRLSSALRHNYESFTPRLWKILAHLGYKKYLQRIYIHIDSPKPIENSLIQLPITLAVLNALDILPFERSICTIGSINSNLEAVLPEFDVCKTAPSSTNNLFLPYQNEKLTNFLQRIVQNSIKPLKTQQSTEYLISKFFPQVILSDSKIDLCRTPLAILKKFTPKAFEQLPYQLDLQSNSIKQYKLEYLLSIPFQNITLRLGKCLCNNIKCICDSKQKQSFGNIQKMISSTSWRIVEPF